MIHAFTYWSDATKACNSVYPMRLKLIKSRVMHWNVEKTLLNNDTKKIKTIRNRLTWLILCDFYLIL